MKIAETPEIKNYTVVSNRGIRGDRTFLGGFQLGTRMRIFWGSGFLSLLILGAIFFRIDTHINAAVDNWKGGQEAVVLMAQIQSGIERAKMLEKKYLILKKRQIVEIFSRELSRVDGNILELYQLPNAEPIRQQISTLRDGLEQYREQFLNDNNIEEKIDLNKPMGLGPKSDELTTTLGEGFRELGLVDQGKQLRGIVDQVIQTIRAGQREKISEIRESYQRQFVALDKTTISQDQKELLKKLFKAHELSLIKILNKRLVEDVGPDQSAEILTYINSSTDILWKFVNDLDLSMTRRLERARDLSRYAIPATAGTVFLWFMLIGIVLFRSVVGPIQTLASASERIALGDKSARIPVRGNVDASGRIAGALEKLVEDLVEADLPKQDVEAIKKQQKSMITNNATYPIRVQADAKEREGENENVLGLRDVSSNHLGNNLRVTPPFLDNSRSGEKVMGGDSIRQISERLTYFSDYMTEAVLDVERTQSLIRYLGEASSQIEILGKFVLGAQDQVNLLTSNFSLNEVDINGLQDPILKHRLNSIRETMEQAGLTLRSVRTLIEKVNFIGQEIAKTSSDQALEANNKLLSQSRSLQDRLDDIMTMLNVNSGVDV